jgi:type II secretory pathway pseudopilin PulG
MRVVLIVVAVLALVGFLAVAVVLPMMADAEAREAAQALLAGSDAAKKQVAAAAEKTKSLDGAGTGVKLAPTKNPKFGELKWIIAPSGEIRGWNEQNAIEIALTPIMQSGKVSWRCRGYPNRAMPADCGGR